MIFILRKNACNCIDLKSLAEELSAKLFKGSL
jgi:hypothetical protein